MKVYILGAGGFGRETLNIYIDLGRKKEVAGFLEENSKREGQKLNGVPIYDVSILNNIHPSEKKEIYLIGGIGTPLKKRLIVLLELEGFKFDTIVHPSAILSRWVEVGEGSIITAGVIITSQVKIGKHCIINLSSTIGHDVTIGDFTNIAPGVNVSGRVKIGEMSFIGTGTSIVEGVKIGSHTFIGAGSVITKDIPDNVLAFGNPARVVREINEEDWKKLI